MKTRRAILRFVGIAVALLVVIFLAVQLSSHHSPTVDVLAHISRLGWFVY